MHRSIARFLLLVALVGTLAPLTFAVTASPHACCVRKNVHHCHDFPVAEEQQLAILDASCCNHTCARAIVSAPWAHAQARDFGSFTPTVEHFLPSSTPIVATAAAFRFRSSRAPPQFSVA